MRRSRSSVSAGLVLLSVLSATACTDKAAEERREFLKLEAAVGTVANADPADRKIRLEELAAVPVSYERVVQLKKICLSAYQAFEQAGSLMHAAQAGTAAAEAKVAEADRKKALGAEMTPAEQAELLTLGKRAAALLEEMTVALTAAEKETAACQAARERLRFETAAP